MTQRQRNASMLFCLLMPLSANAGEKRIYQTDYFGNIQNHKPTLSTKK